MKKSMYLMVFMVLASMAMATIGPITSVATNDVGVSPNQQKFLQSITVGTDTVTSLVYGTTTQYWGTPIVPLLRPLIDDTDLNTGYGRTSGTHGELETVLFGGKNFFSTNGSLPDFFLFEGAGTGSGNPDDVAIAAVLTNGTLGAAVELPTGMSGWGNCGILTGSFQNGQTIAGICWDITDLKDAAGSNLASNAKIKGVRIVHTATRTQASGIDVSSFCAAPQVVLRGQAHTPVPTDMATLVDSTAVTSVSWRSPEEDKDGNFVDDPNIVSVGYDVWFETHEPNDVTDTRKSTNQPGKSWTITPALAYSTTYYWRVDARLSWNAPGFPAIVKGYVWQFTTKPFYTPPVLTFDGVITTQSLLPAALSASVTGNTLPITSRTFTLLTGDIEYPAGAIAVLTDTTTDNLNPTATLTTDKVGKYKVKLVVSDGTTPVEKIAEVLVYASTDDCAARKAAGGWVKNYYDDNGNCAVTLFDFVPLAKAWLNNTGYTTQQTYTGAVNPYVPKSIFDARIEAESVSQTDPNAVSDFPITDTTGIRIDVEPTAMGGGKNLGSTVSGFAQYTVNIPAAGTYDLHVCSAAADTGNVMSFGVAGTPALYGSVSDLPATGWDNWHYTVHPGALTFTSAGPTVVRITWNATSRDLDWFTLVKQ